MVNRRSLILVSVGHFIVDSCAGFFPMYMAMRNLDIVKAGAISTFSTMISNFLQPVFGLLADKIDKKILVTISLFFAPLFMSLIGLTDNYLILAILVVLGKLMVSLFHPVGVDASTTSSNNSRSPMGFAFFTTAGTIGFALTGFIFYRFCTFAGYHNSFYLAIPGIIAAPLFYLFWPKSLSSSRKKNVLRGFLKMMNKNIKFISILFSLVVIRGTLQVSMVFTLPTLFKEWGFDESIWSLSHFLFIFSGAVSIFIFGLYNKKFNPVNLIMYSMILAFPVFYLALYYGVAGSYVSLLFISLLGFINFSSFPANIILGQQRVPEYAASISGILMGAAWGVSGFAPILISAMAKSAFLPLEYGRFVPGLMVVGLLPIVGIGLCLLLKVKRSW